MAKKYLVLPIVAAILLIWFCGCGGTVGNAARMYMRAPHLEPMVIEKGSTKDNVYGAKFVWPKGVL
jgi:hypothetical protein